MKKFLLLALPLMVMCFASCEKEEEWTDDSPIIQFKDPKFLNALLEGADGSNNNPAYVDKNGDGQISEKEASVVEVLFVNGSGIRNLDEISYFTALIDLHCIENQLTSLDLSNNTALVRLYCYENQLTSLDLSNNTALTYLECDNNQLTSLDLSNNTALTYLECDNNQLTSLDLSNNTALTYLECDNNQLTSLDLSNNTALTRVSCTQNQLTSLDVSGCTALTELSCYENQLTTLDVSSNIELQELWCTENNITSIDLSSNRDLRDFNWVSASWLWRGDDIIGIESYDKESACPLKSVTLYKYHMLNTVSIARLKYINPDIEIIYVE